MTGLALAHASCDDQAIQDNLSVGRISPSLSMQSPAVALLAGKAAAGETLITAVEADLPLTSAKFYEGKFLTASNKVVGRAYTPAGAPVDATAARKAEHAAYRAKHGAWSPADLQRLKGMAASKQVIASLWVGFFVPDSAKTLASVAPLAAAAKAPVKQALAKGAITTLWDDPYSPLLLVKGAPGAILSLGFHPSVDSAETTTGMVAHALGTPGDGQEKIDAHMPILVSTHGDLTNAGESWTHDDLGEPHVPQPPINPAEFRPTAMTMVDGTTHLAVLRPDTVLVYRDAGEGWKEQRFEAASQPLSADLAVDGQGEAHLVYELEEPDGDLNSIYYTRQTCQLARR